MKKKLICVICAALAAVMLYCGTVLTVGGSGSTAVSSSLAALEDELANAIASREAAEKALSGAEAGYADALTKKQAIDGKIYALDVEIEALEALIKGINDQIAVKDGEIAAENAKLSDQYETVRTRIRIKHEEGGVDFLAILLESGGLSEFFARLDRYMCMLEYDKTLLEQYKTGIANLTKLREELDVSKKMLNQQMINLEDRRKDLEAELADASRLVASAENKLSTAEEDLKRVAQAELEYSNRREEMLMEIELTTNEKTVEGEFIWPLSDKYTKVTSGFGWRIHPVTGRKQHHNGIDIPAPYGTEIMAVNDGTVIECSYNYADGYYITVSHGGGVASFYSHLSRYRVKVGDKVEKGQVIANVGTSGYVTGAHLNLNMYENNAAVDPMKFFD